MRRKVPDFLGAGASRCHHQDCLWDSVRLNHSQMDGWNDVVAEGDLKVQLFSPLCLIFFLNLEMKVSLNMITLIHGSFLLECGEQGLSGSGR